VPDLAEEGDWLEVPFWGWRSGEARRGRLFVRRRSDCFELRAGTDAWPDLPTRPADLVEAWRGLARTGHKVRSRALMTTMYARLFLAHLFIHGIGGGKYDELTDALIRQFFGVEPPAFLVLSATRWLPLPAYPATPDERRRLIRRLRELRYNPQRHLPEGAAASLRLLLAERQRWVEAQPTTSDGRRERFRAIRTLNEQLAPPLAEEEESTLQDLRQVEQQLAANALLRRRDYSFCLFPAASLQPFCTRLL
jgi:hypothetical protein